MTSSWKWASRADLETTESVSVLALAETIAAASVYAIVAVKYGTLHLTISACVAPFLLLRTDRSTQRGLSLAAASSGPIIDELDNLTIRLHGRWAYYPVVIVLIPVVVAIIALTAFAARIGATVMTAMSHPVETLRAVPANWWRFVARIDSTTIPEAVPGAAQNEGERLAPFNARKVIANLSSRGFAGMDDAVAKAIVLPLYVLFVFMPVLAYRWSVKGTSLIYSPLIYVAHASFSVTSRSQLLDIKELALHRVMRAYAAVVLILFAAKLYVFVAWENFSRAWGRLPAVELLNAYVAPNEIPVWQLASVGNALLAWAVYFFADQTVARLSRTGNWTEPPKHVSDITQALFFVRGILSIYTIACVLYISASLALQVNWPPLGSRLFPW